VPNELTVIGITTPTGRSLERSLAQYLQRIFDSIHSEEGIELEGRPTTDGVTIPTDPRALFPWLKRKLFRRVKAMLIHALCPMLGLSSHLSLQISSLCELCTLFLGATVNETEVVEVFQEMCGGRADPKSLKVLANFVVRLCNSSGKQATQSGGGTNSTQADLKDYVRVIFQVMASKKTDALQSKTMTRDELQSKTMTRDEFVKTVHDVFKLPFSKDVLTELFAKVDADANNSLSIEEFDIATSHITNEVMSQVRAQLGVSRDALVAQALLSSVALAAVLVFLGLGILSFGATEAFASSVSSNIGTCTRQSISCPLLCFGRCADQLGAHGRCVARCDVHHTVGRS
jgi:hypothetical protein